ncbi:ecotin family protein [Pseudomonas sp. OST1909]|uniref:ecotin family protein n=1 Tax=Pseudomonas sp. OST1909 TaxID=2777367 RepID=UPI001888C673|nr:ecotin family protein [Pseudomonas sp. OST1909]QOY72759.1 serine protease [Pseudomonas sp. OST1909]
MDITQSVISEIVTAVVAALDSTPTIEPPITPCVNSPGTPNRPENAWVPPAYRKHIFWLDKRNNEESLVVVIHGGILMDNDCADYIVMPGVGGELRMTDAGYYQIDRPHPHSHLKRPRLTCGSLPRRRHPLYLHNNVLNYSSSNPIVIHAHEDINVSYVVQEKRAEATTG